MKCAICVIYQLFLFANLYAGSEMPLSLANGSKVNKALLEAEKKNGLYVCTKCDKKFARLDSLKQHLGTHDQNFALQCPMCEMTFGWASTLRRHKGFQITLALKIPESKVSCNVWVVWV